MQIISFSTEQLERRSTGKPDLRFSEWNISRNGASQNGRAEKQEFVRRHMQNSAHSAFSRPF